MKQIEAILTNKDMSDSVKVTLALAILQKRPPPENLAETRNLPTEIVKRHLLHMPTEEVSPQTGDIISLYAITFKERFGYVLSQPNLRAAVKNVVARQGYEKTRVLLQAWLAGCRTAEDARIVKFFAKYGTKLSSKAKSAR